MIVSTLPPGYVRALLERPVDKALIAAGNDVLGGNDPTSSMRSYRAFEDETTANFVIDRTFGAIPIGAGASSGERVSLESFLQPNNSERFLVSGFLRVNGDSPPEYIEEKGERYPVHSNPIIGGLQHLQPCLPTCGSSQPVGDAHHVRHKLKFDTLQDNGLDGSGVALAIVDSGIYKPRLERLLGGALQSKRQIYLDANNSWRPPQLVTQPGQHRVGHGTMCAYDALIMAPKATLIDVPMLITRPVADHRSKSMAAAAILAYVDLGLKWMSNRFNALVVSNSWGLFHPCLEDYPPGHPFRFIDNRNHIFHHLVAALAAEGVDIIFCGNNCGSGSNCAGHCASGTCLSKTDRTITAANSYEEVLTIGGCDTHNRLVGYSSCGPSIQNMAQEKPDLLAYTHFLGSKVLETFVPDTGVSTACPVAAGCVAALRTKVNSQAVPPVTLFERLRNTATKLAGQPPGWDACFGHGIINPVAAGRALGVIP